MNGESERILLLAENWPPRRGGIENYLTHIAQYLPRGSVTVVAPKSKGFKKNRFGDINIIRKRFFWPFFKPSWLPLRWYLYKKAKKDKIDIVLCGKALFEGRIGYYLKKQLGIPYIVFTYAMEIEAWKKNRRNLRNLKKVLINADRVICINKVTKAELLNLGVSKQNIVKVWPGVDERFLADISQEEIDKNLNKYEIDKPYVFSLARLIKRKGMDTLIEAFSDLDQTKFGQFQLVIAGSGPEKDALERLSKNLWIDTTVKFLDDVDDEDLPALYKGASLFALTPRNIDGDFEGFGIVYLEANAVGTPVLGSASGGISEAVDHKKSGIIIQPGSAFAARKALEYLLDNEELLRKLGAQGRKRAYDKFRWTDRIKLLTGVIDEITHTKRS